MTHSVNPNQPLSPATSDIAQWAHERSGHHDRDGDYAWAQHHGLPLSQADLAMAIGGANLLVAETNTVYSTGHHSLRLLASHLGAG